MLKPDRILFSIKNNPKLPTIIYFCCVHGNEKAGYHALNQFYNDIQKSKLHLEGNIFGIIGNREAFLQDNRFLDKDLNRIWTTSHIASALDEHISNEYVELLDVYEALYHILNWSKSTVYAIDLHTTSAPTKPFIVMNDALNNRAFVRKMGYPIIFNIETFVNGTLLNLLSNLGHVSIAFEGGEHFAEKAISEIKCFCMKTLFFTGMVDDEKLEQISFSKEHIQLRTSPYFELVFRLNLEAQDDFKMKSGFKNFQVLKEGEEIAEMNGEKMYAPKSTRIFMPLYQSKGEDGFFLIKQISNFKLKIARYLRYIQVEKLLQILPGIKKMNPYTLQVPKAIDQFIPKRVLFALGYRKSIESTGNYLYTKQEREVQALPRLKNMNSNVDISSF